MPEDRTARPAPEALVQALADSYAADRRTAHLDAMFLPSRDRAIELLGLFQRLMFPGFFDARRLAADTVHGHIADLLAHARAALYEQTRHALRYEADRDNGHRSERPDCDRHAASISDELLGCLPALRDALALDAQAAFDGDPAAVSTDEVVFCYPGLYAIFVHRVAHALWQRRVPLLPRIMSEHAHSLTGIDIHPGAEIGQSFFIDHGTGVVIGETCVIGDRVKIYQGVTLGALSTKGGQAWRGRRRHPSIEDDVTIYGGAIILGGETVIGRGATVGGSVFLTSSVPPDHTVTMKQPELTLSAKRKAKTGRAAAGADKP